MKEIRFEFLISTIFNDLYYVDCVGTVGGLYTMLHVQYTLDRGNMEEDDVALSENNDNQD